jgi:hypothetical protein
LPVSGWRQTTIQRVAASTRSGMRQVGADHRLDLFGCTEAVMPTWNAQRKRPASPAFSMERVPCAVRPSGGRLPAW